VENINIPKFARSRKNESESEKTEILKKSVKVKREPNLPKKDLVDKNNVEENQKVEEKMCTAEGPLETRPEQTEKPQTELPKQDTTTTTTLQIKEESETGVGVKEDSKKSSILDFFTDPLQNVASW